MKIPSLLLLLGTVALSAAIAESAAAPLNVLFIISDDLNNDLGCYGNPVVKSPNIDRLAARGIRFDRAYCNYPVCNASRVSFLSGRRPDSTGVTSNMTHTRAVLGNHVFLPEYFRIKGYRTMKAGKVYHSQKFEDPLSWNVAVHEDKQSEDPAPEEIIRRQGPEGVVLNQKDEETPDGYFARKAIEFLEECAKDRKPFFVAAGFRRPHTPYAAPEKYFSLYDPAKLKPRYGPEGHWNNIPDIALTWKLWDKKRFPENRPGDTMAAYYASISFMDAQVGLLLDAMERLRLFENTIVVFISDHGYHMGEHGGLQYKMCLFDETTRVPLIVAAPGRKPAVSNALVELVDLYPTLAELCGLDVPKNLDGTSFVPVLEQPNRLWKKAVFTVAARNRDLYPHAPKGMKLDGMGRTVFDGRWRYTEWPDGSRELYDHQDDPFEYSNLASTLELRAQMERSGARLRAGWRAALPPH